MLILNAVWNKKIIRLELYKVIIVGYPIQKVIFVGQVKGHFLKVTIQQFDKLYLLEKMLMEQET